MSLNSESICAIMVGIAFCTLFICIAFGSNHKDSMNDILWACHAYNISEQNCYEALQRAKEPYIK